MTSAAVAARRGRTVVDVDLAMGAGESVGAAALERVYQVGAYAVVQAWICGALVYVDLALRTGETC